MRIAVFLDSEQKPSAPHEAAMIAFYAKQDGTWEQTEIQFLQPLQNTSVFLVTAFIDQLAKLVQDAQAVAGSSIAGVAYSVFNRQGKHIFEIPELTPEQISGIAEDIALAEAKRRLDEKTFAGVLPVETDIAGVYAMDLVTAQEAYPDLSSKMILKPFFRNTPFMELSIICKHVPPWLATETGLVITQKPRGGYWIVAVSKTTCKEASE